MAPKALINQLKQRVELQKKLEDARKREIEAEEARIREEELNAKRQKEYEENLRKEQQIIAKKQDKKTPKSDNYEALYQLHKSGMVINVTPELADYIASREATSNVSISSTVTSESKHSLSSTQNTTDKQSIILNDTDISDKMIEINLHRAPICCVLGHVDAGKTSFLDKLRNSNIQANENNGITQQIGATLFPKSYVNRIINPTQKAEGDIFQLPGILMIDTPGHESFSNMRNTGSTLCDLAIVVVDIMNGIQSQKDIIAMLNQKRYPYIILINKIDKLYGFDPSIRLQNQAPYTLGEYDTRIHNIKTQLTNIGLNSALHDNNPDDKTYVNMVPISSKTGHGIDDVLSLITHLTSKYLSKRLTVNNDAPPNCTIMEMRQTPGYGMTLDVILVSGMLHAGDTIVLCGYSDVIVTKIRFLLTHNPIHDSQLNNKYTANTTVCGTQCLKLVTTARLAGVCSGTQMYVVKHVQQYNGDAENDDGDNTIHTHTHTHTQSHAQSHIHTQPNAYTDEIEKYKRIIQSDINNTITKAISPDKIGVSVQSSTMGALEALITFSHQMNIPIGSINLGPIHKKHLTHACMMRTKNPKYACVLSFECDMDTESKRIADQNNIRIIQANVIFHLFDGFTKYINDYNAEIKRKNQAIAIFPTVVRVLSCIRARNPLIIGCRIEEGNLHVGTPLYVTSNNNRIGHVLSMQLNNTNIDIAKKGMDVAVKLDGKLGGKLFDALRTHVAKSPQMHNTIVQNATAQNAKDRIDQTDPAKVSQTQADDHYVTYGRHLDDNDVLHSIITRQSIDALKESFREDMSDDDWKLIIRMKAEQKIV